MFLGIRKIWVALLSVPKSLVFNFSHFKITEAIKMPVLLHYKTNVNIKGQIMFVCPVKFGLVHYGFHEVEACDSTQENVLKVFGKLILKGEAHLGKGTKIIVYPNGELELGDNFAISASSVICCYKHIVFGKDIQFSWDCLVMDSDTHLIFDDLGNQINQDKEIVFGNKVWIGNGCMILKGTKIPDTCVIGAKSVVSGAKYSSHTIIAGNPARSIKNIGDFKI